MATTYNPGGQSPTSFSKTLDRVFDDAQHTGEVNLSGRKLKEYPKISAKYDLVDSIGTDLSRNRFSEIPQDVCDYASLERLNCYNNVIKSIPEALIQLHTLTHLNLSRNLLSNIPPFISQVPVLEVLIAANNRLVSLPEEIGKLERLMHIDVSCNEISHLPPQMGDLESLRILNVRRNLLVEIPVEICRLKLRRLDISENKISTIPTIFRKMDTLEEILLDHNPLISPPAHVCTKGRVHILKYLQIEAIKEDRKMGVLSDTDMRRHVRKSLPQSAVSADGIKDLVDKAVSADGRWKRHTVVGSDSGYSSNSIADSSNEKPSWNQTEELQRQKAEYERRKKLAEQIRLQHEEVEEREERRRAAVRLQEEQQRVLSEQKQRDNDARLREAAEDLARQREAEVARQREAEEAARQREADVIRQQADIAKQQEAEQARQIEETRKAAAELKAHGRGQPVARETISGRREIPVQHKTTTSKDQDVAAKTTRPENKRVAAISRITPSHMTKRKVTTNMTSNAREEKRALSTAAPYHRTSSDSAKNIRSYQTTNGLTENGVGHEKSPSPATSPASSIGSSPRSSTSSLSNVSKTSTTNAPTVRRVQIEDRRGTSVNSTSSVSGTQSPATRRTRLAGGISSSSSSTTTTSATSSVGGRGRGTTTTTGLSTISSMNRTRPGFSATTTSTSRTMPLSSRNNLTTRTANHIDEKSQAQNNMNAMNKSRQALSAGAMKMLQEYRESDPNFTIRRREELIRDEADQTQRLRQTIETRLKVTLPDNLPEALRDGVVLCHLANQIRPRSVASIHVPSPAVPKLTMAKCRRNVDNFLEACRKIGINQNQICTAHDILEERGLTRISLTVTALTGITAVSPKHQSIV